jgi:hypothetical protein
MRDWDDGQMHFEFLLRPSGLPAELGLRQAGAIVLVTYLPKSF